MLSKTDIELVQDSFGLIVPKAAVVAELFYERLFAENPELRPLFPEHMEEQRGKLVVTLASVVQSLHSFDEVIDAVRALGKRHVGYRAKPEHYQAVGTALLWTLETSLSDEWTPELQRGWTNAYGTLADVMIEAAGEIKAA